MPISSLSPPKDQVSKDKALQSMASMSSAQIVSASVLQNKLSPPPPLPQAVFSAAPRVRTALCPQSLCLGLGERTHAWPWGSHNLLAALWKGHSGGCRWVWEDQGVLTVFSLLFPSFGVGRSQGSLDPLRSKYKPPCQPAPPWDPTLLT